MQHIDHFKNYLNNHYNFRLNEISSKVEFKPISRSSYKSMTDRDLNSLLIEMVHNDCKIKSLDLKTIIESDYVPIFNPIKDYFEFLPQLTGNENIKKLLKTIETHDNDFFDWAFTKWLVAWVACMVEDNAINQQCVILAGNQGIGKSTWVEKLIPNELMPYYFAGNIKLGNKDTLGFLSEKCLINLDELANMTYSNVAELKELVTKSKISFRKAYGKFADNFIRRASFIGSVNGTEFLYDLTGNRRFLSFEVSRFENYGNHNVDMNLVFAEVYSLFKSGFQYWFDANNQKRVEKNNESFRVISPEEVKILELFSCTPLEKNVIDSLKEEHLNSIGRNRFESANRISLRKKQVEEEINNLKNPKFKLPFELYQLITKRTPTQGELVKFGKILTKIGFKRKRSSSGTLYEVYYLKPDLSNLD